MFCGHFFYFYDIISDRSVQKQEHDNEKEKNEIKKAIRDKHFVASKGETGRKEIFFFSLKVNLSTTIKTCQHLS